MDRKTIYRSWAFDDGVRAEENCMHSILQNKPEQNKPKQRIGDILIA